MNNNIFFTYLKCHTPSTRTRITFNENKICFACSFLDKKLTIDWKARKLELYKIFDMYRKKIAILMSW